MKIQSILDQANLILANHLEMSDDSVADQGAMVKQDVLELAGFTPSKRTDETWCDYLESTELPWKYRKTLIALDDVIDSHNKTRYS
jgi:hypothetical protein